MTDLSDSTELPDPGPAPDLSSEPIEDSSPPESWAGGETADLAPVDETPEPTEEPLPDASTWGGSDTQELPDGAEYSGQGNDEFGEQADDPMLADGQEGVLDSQPESWAADEVVNPDPGDTGSELTGEAPEQSGDAGGEQSGVAEGATFDSQLAEPQADAASVEHSLPAVDEPGAPETAETDAEPAESSDSTDVTGPDPAPDTSTEPIEDSSPPESWAGGETADLAPVDETPEPTEEPLPDASTWGGSDTQELPDGAEYSGQGNYEFGQAGDPMLGDLQTEAETEQAPGDHQAEQPLPELEQPGALDMADTDSEPAELSEPTELPDSGPPPDASTEPIEDSSPPESWAGGETADLAPVDKTPEPTEEPVPDGSTWGSSSSDTQELSDGSEYPDQGADTLTTPADDPAVADGQEDMLGAQTDQQLAGLQTEAETGQAPNDQPNDQSLPPAEQPGALETAVPDSGPDDEPEQGPISDIVGFEPSMSKTDVGSAFFAPNDAIWESTKDVPDYPGEYVMDLHGSPTSVSVPGSDGVEHSLTPAEFATLVKNGTDWNGEPIRLFSCETGQRPDGFGQQLADELGVPVTAPTEAVSPNPTGKDYPAIIESAAPQKKFGGLLYVPAKSGEWKTFTPKGKAGS